MVPRNPNLVQDMKHSLSDVNDKNVKYARPEECIQSLNINWAQLDNETIPIAEFKTSECENCK